MNVFLSFQLLASLWTADVHCLVIGAVKASAQIGGDSLTRPPFVFNSSTPSCMTWTGQSCTWKACRSESNSTCVSMSGSLKCMCAEGYCASLSGKCEAKETEEGKDIGTYAISFLTPQLGSPAYIGVQWPRIPTVAAINYSEPIWKIVGVGPEGSGLVRFESALTGFEGLVISTKKEGDRRLFVLKDINKVRPSKVTFQIRRLGLLPGDIEDGFEIWQPEDAVAMCSVKPVNRASKIMWWGEPWIYSRNGVGSCRKCRLQEQALKFTPDLPADFTSEFFRDAKLQARALEIGSIPWWVLILCCLCMLLPAVNRDRRGEFLR